MNLQLLPYDVASYLFSFLTSKQRADICSVSKWFESIAVDVSKQLSATPELYHWNPLRKVPKNKLKIVSMNDYHLLVRLRQFNKLDFTKVCKRGDVDVINLSIIRLHEIKKTHKSLSATVKSGKLNVVKILLSSIGYSIGDLIDAMKAASKIGSMQMVMLLLEEIEELDPNREPYILDTSIYAASKYGYIDIVEYLKTKREGTTWDCYIMGAAKGGHVNIIDLAYAEYVELHGREMDNHYLNEALGNACWNGHQEASKKLIELGATHCDSCHRDTANH